MPFDKPTRLSLQVLDSRRKWVIDELPQGSSDDHLEYLGDAGWIEIRFFVEGWSAGNSWFNWYWPRDDLTVAGEWPQVLAKFGRNAKHPLEVRVSKAGKQLLRARKIEETDPEAMEGSGGGITLDDFEDPIQVVQVADSVEWAGLGIPREELPSTAEGKATQLPELRHSPDFRSVHWFGTDYTFTAMQAAVVSVLWQAWEQGTPDVSDAHLLTKAGAEGNRLANLFRKHATWGKMIVDGATKGTKRLQATQEA